jgi:pimeloyl-ACP methyl ester carboxylesterase
VLAEYLASHGYFVVATPSPMVRTPMTGESQVAEFAERQARELEEALHLVGRSCPTADLSRVGIVGHSFGARAALLLAMRNRWVRALVSLDGGIGTATASGTFRRAPSFDTTKAVAPILHYFERLDPFMAPDFEILNGLPATVTTREVADMHHVHFTTLGFIAAMVPEVAVLTGAGKGIDQSLQRVARGALDFFETHVARRRR